MTKISFSDMSLTPKVAHAVSLMGFDFATPVQSEAIPVIRTGADVIARSQTGTGKTVAFAIPAIERVDTHAEKPAVQVMILCPTRELALQACEEIKKLARFKEGIRPVALYGGAPIDKQCIALRRANLVVGTPGRVMDHMRRKTLKLDHLKMIVLDEADEMLNMGFKEDIETILTDTPADRQTVLFSATMPPAILKITKEFQKDPVLIEIDKSQVTLENIHQRYVEVPHAAKKRALASLLDYYQPNRAIIFCGTKKMADELSEFFADRGISAESIHSDIKQSQRTTTMHHFKTGKTAILIATDIAARGIDVSNVEYVINYDLPQNAESYVHRIGRTGRAGKNGCSITICGSKRETAMMRQIARMVKSEIEELKLPTAADLRAKQKNQTVEELEALLQRGAEDGLLNIVDTLVEKGYALREIAAVALALSHPALAQPLEEPSWEQAERGAREERPGPLECGILLLDIGSGDRVSANHILGAVTERTGLSGKMIGKIDIFPGQTLVEVPEPYLQEVLASMEGCKICGKPVHASLLAEAPRKAPRRMAHPVKPGKGFHAEGRRGAKRRVFKK